MTNTNQRRLFRWSLLALAAVFGVLSAAASSHREAPGILSSPQVDGTDFYMFRSYEEGRDGFVMLIADYNPLQDPYGGPNYFPLDPNAAYDIHINNNGGDNPDGQITEDITFRFRFTQTSPFLTVPVDGQDIAVPLSNIAPFGVGFGGMLNQNRIYTVELIRGDVTNPTSRTLATNRGTGGIFFGYPFDNVGEKSIPNGYAAYADTFIHPIGIPGCDDGKVFAGQRNEPFAVNLGEVFDLINLDPVGNPDAERSDTADKNITSLILEVPTDCLTGGGSGIIGGWTTARLPRDRTLTDNPTYDDPDQQSGDLVQVSRLANPLVNEVAIGLPDKNLFNASHPRDDGANFLQYVTNPTLPVLIEALFGVPAPTNIPRNDLVKLFLTGFPGLNADGSVGEVMRLNTAIPFTPFFLQNNQGVAGGDNGGFPNGRRPGDDVVDGTLRAAMGAFCFVPDPNAPPTGDEYNATLLGPNVVPPVNTNAMGTCVGGLNGNNFFATCNHNVRNVIRGSFRQGALGEEGPEICRDATGPAPVVFANCFLSPEELAALLSDDTYIELSTINNPNGEVRGQVMAPRPPSLGMCDPADALGGNSPLTDGAYQGPDQFDDVFPYLNTPLPGSPNERNERTANLIEDWVADPPVGDFRGWASMKRTESEDPEFEVMVRTNVDPPYTVNITLGGPLGDRLWFFRVDQPGEQVKLLKQEDYVGTDPLPIFADGFESGDISAWSSVTPGTGSLREEPNRVDQLAPVIAGPFR